MAFMTGLFDPYAGAGADQRYAPQSNNNKIREILAGLSTSTGMPSSEISLEGGSSHGAAYGQEDVPAAVPPWQELLSQIMGGGGQQDMSGAYGLAMQTAGSPYAPILRDLRRQMRDSRSQTAQNQADINSWFGQLGSMYTGGAKGARRSTRRAGRENASFNKNILSGVADPGVARSLAAGGQSDARHISESGVAEANFLNRQASDAQRQAAYQNLVQTRLGMAERQDIRAEMAKVKSAKASAIGEAMQEIAGSQGDPMENLFKFLTMLPEDARMQFLTQGTLSGGEGGGFDVDAATNLAAALGGVKESVLQQVPDERDPKKKNPTFITKDFDDLLGAMRSAATSAQIDLNDPASLQAFRSWIAAHILPQWNNIARQVPGRHQWVPGPNGFKSIGE
jgi:hypothetical protein